MESLQIAAVKRLKMLLIDERGHSTVELALVLPLVVFLLVTLLSAVHYGVGTVQTCNLSRVAVRSLSMGKPAHLPQGFSLSKVESGSEITVRVSKTQVFNNVIPQPHCELKAPKEPYAQE